MPTKCRNFILAIAVVLLLGTVTPATADEQSECARPIDATFGNKLLTRAEKVEILSQRFFDELARFEDCLAMSSGGGSAGTSGGSSVTGSGVQGENSTSQTFAAAEPIQASGIQGTEISELDNESPSLIDENQVDSNGKSPEELEDLDNEAALLEQIRQAAISEQDPELKAKLWQEYNKRKSGQGGGT